MLLTNLHSFHFSQILQNATALPEHAYQNINNRSSINQSLQRYNNGHENPLPSGRETRSFHSRRRQRKAYSQWYATWNTKKAITPLPPEPLSAESFVPSPFPEYREPVTVDGKIKPNTPLSGPTKKATSTQNKNKQRKRIIWKPGRGTIEKIDKHSGEIVHMVEETILS